MIASDTLFDSRGLVFGLKLSNEDIADFEVLWTLPWQPFVGFLYMRYTLSPPGKYD